MQYKVFLFTMALSLVISNHSFAQGPVGDEVMVTFDQTVQVGSHSLPAGKYTIKQVTSASNPRILEFTSRNGTKLDATVAAVPILQNTPPSKTRVIVDNEGGTPRLSRIWVQGKSYGYEFPGHGKVGVANGNVSVANNATLQGTFVAQAATAPAPVAQERTPAPAPAPAAVAEERTPAPAPAPAPVAQTPPPSENPVAQNRPAETPAPPPAAQAQTPPPAQTQSSQNEAAPSPSLNQNAPAETAQNDTRREVPATALGWIQIALLGMALAFAGGVLYWRERSQARRSNF